VITNCKTDRLDGVPNDDMLVALQKEHHGQCPVCSASNRHGLHATYRVREDGCVEASLTFLKEHEGYEGHIHGGFIAAALDGAMTNCLFSHGVTGVTGELTVRMLKPLAGEKGAVVRAWIKRTLGPLYVLSAELYEKESLVAKAEGKFVSKEIGLKR
jgi:acyl-coenzyme A thioesterase PaaI-like protein